MIENVEQSRFTGLQRRTATPEQIAVMWKPCFQLIELLSERSVRTKTLILGQVASSYLHLSTAEKCWMSTLFRSRAVSPSRFLTIEDDQTPYGSNGIRAIVASRCLLLMLDFLVNAAILATASHLEYVYEIYFASLQSRECSTARIRSPTNYSRKMGDSLPEITKSPHET